MHERVCMFGIASVCACTRALSAPLNYSFFTSKLKFKVQLYWKAVSKGIVLEIVRFALRFCHFIQRKSVKY